MLANAITLSVDTLNNGTPTDQVATRHEEHLNRTVYRMPGHSVGSPQTLTWYRTPPKRNGNFNGTYKCALKFSATKFVAGYDAATTLSVPVIAEVSFSLPVGTSADFMKEVRQQCIAALDDDIIMDQLMVLGEV